MDFELVLETARGFLHLRLYDDAWNCLRSLDREWAARPEVWTLRSMILMERREWQKALAILDDLCAIYPENLNNHLRAAYCLHELQRTAEARERLLGGPAELRRLSLYHLNLACYEAELGNLQAAKMSIRAGYRLDRQRRRREMSDARRRGIKRC